MTDLSRRKLLVGLGALIAAPAVVRSGILMPIRGILMPMVSGDWPYCFVVHPSIIRDLLLASGGDVDWLTDEFRYQIGEIKEFRCS